MLPNHQFGFRHSHSCTQQILRVTKHVKHQMQNGKSTGLIALDIEKAFDNVWHKGLILKLRRIGFH